ncbi:MAG: sulfatase-like hydrolase/transferase [Myxococcota bacterium]|nr:sulfatase-like hydrolase/transferase [Myxococcota bacterium]
MNTVAKSAAVAFVSGATFALLEVWVAYTMPAPLDPVPTVIAAAASVAATGTVVGLLGFGFALVSPRTAAGLALAVWASLWGPQQAQNAGWYRVGWCPPVVIAGMALVAPPAAVLLGTAGGASGAWVRSSGDAVGFTPTARQENPGASNPNILLVTLDGIRKDSLLLHGGRWKPTSPFSPMAGWTHFSEAVAPAPWSLPSVHSLMSAMPVRDHGGGLPTSLGHTRRVNEAVPFAYMLQAEGYQTAALVSSGTLTPEHGFADGFDEWLHTDDAVEPLMLLQLYAKATAWLSGEQPELDASKHDRLVRRAREMMGRPTDRPQMVWVHLSAPDAVRDIMDGMEASDAYAAGVERRRKQVTQLVNAVPGWVVAVVGTHGVSIGEDGRMGFGHRLDDEELRVPMAIRRPGTQGGIVNRQVATADLGHTLLASAGAARMFPGQNLLVKRGTPVEVGGVRHDGNAFAGRTGSGKYLRRDKGTVGPGVKLSDRSQEQLRRTGYLD